ncbi:MAG: HlyD family efflux transporter periplasmic adaptor subunit, partial [Chloroflexota bacterium]
KKKLIISLSILILALFLGASVSFSPVEVGETGVVSSLSLNKVISNGELAAEKYKIIAWDTDGTVSTVNIIEGSSVKKGDILATLDKKSLTYEMKNSLKDYEDINFVISQRNADHGLYLDTANAAVAYFRKKVEGAQNYYRNIETSRATPEFLKEFQKYIIEEQMHEIALRKKYERVKHDSEWGWVIMQAKYEWEIVKSQLDEDQKSYNYYVSGPTDEEIITAKLKLEDGKDQLARAKIIRDNIKNGDFSVLFRYHQGYDYYDYFSNINNPSIDKWNISSNDIDARLNTLQLEIDRINTIAPFDGKIASINTNAGQTVQTGSESMTIIDPNSLIVKVLVPEKYIPKISPGSRVKINIPVLDKQNLSGTIKYIDPIAKAASNISVLSDPNNQLEISQGTDKYFEIKIKLEQTDVPLFLGATSEVEIPLNESVEELMVPANVIQWNDNGYFVSVIGQLNLSFDAPVTIGQNVGGNVVIYPVDIGAVKAGDKVKITGKTN